AEVAPRATIGAYRFAQHTPCQAPIPIGCVEARNAPGAECSAAVTRRHPGRQGGFTIVEVVVALTVLSLIVLATLTAVQTFGDTQARLETTLVRLDQMRMVSQFLRSTLRQAVPAVNGDPSTFALQGAFQ